MLARIPLLASLGAAPGRLAPAQLGCENRNLPGSVGCVEPDIIASRVREAIGRTGIPDAAFAERVGLDKSKLSKSLGGTRRFTSVDLANVAEVAGVTVDWLLGKDTAPALAARTAEMATSSVRNAVAEEVAKYAQVRSDLLFLGFNQAPSPPIAVPDSGRWIDQGERLAAEALKYVPDLVAKPGAVDLADLIEDNFGADIVITGLAAGCDGVAWHEPGVRLIIVATSPVPTRQRFTLAHELGHLLAGDDQQLWIDEDVMDPADRRQPSEMRANAFAAAFLMPETTVRQTAERRRGDGQPLTEHDFAAMVMEFVVSPSALSYRLSNLGLIDPRQRSSFASLTTTRCAELAEQVETYVEWAAVGARQRPPLAMLGQVLSAYLDGKTTLRPLANLTGVPVDQLRRGLAPMIGSAAETEQEGPVFAP